MNSIPVFIEAGKKRRFAGAIDWPGWCRSAPDEEMALRVLADYGQRYNQVMQPGRLEFPAPVHASDFKVIERRDGNATTDFGVPSVVMDVDKAPVDRAALERFQTLLRLYWQAFDRAVKLAADKTLRKGPRGGGREVGEMVAHVIGADQAYLAKLAWKFKAEAGLSPAEALARTRQAILEAVEQAVRSGLPEQGPRGGSIWPVRYFIRRVAWHVLDHTWEIEDRIQ